MSSQREISIHVPVLARVEGEGALDLDVRNGQIERLNLRIFEPPRLFEKFLEGRDYFEVPDMVARICGICPAAYQMSAVHALERVFNVEPGPWVRAMRRALYCGEWIQSHSLHIHLLAAPDFLGFDSVIGMAHVHPNEVRRGLRVQAAGNELIRLFGARSVHPVGVRVGGFHRAPAPNEVDRVLATLRAIRADAEALVEWTASLGLPETEQDFVSVALSHPDEYPMNEGRLVSSAGLDIDVADFEQHFAEHQVPHSTALHCLLEDEPYLVGPLARLNLNAERLPAAVRAALARTGLTLPSRNPFDGIVARAVEIYCAVVEATRILETYRAPDAAGVAVAPRPGTGFGCTEAPRGVLWHRYDVDADGKIAHARIVPPTSQNQARIEADLRSDLESFGLTKPDDVLRKRCEAVIRSYDPCISCATHFLRLQVNRS